MKRTALFDEHVKLGGRMVDFAGWELPVMYGSIVDEHTAVRERAGLFDVSHMGEVLVRGPHAADFLARLIPTRLDKITPGKSMYSSFLNERGGVIDDLFVYMVSGEEYFLVINASTTEKDLAWMRAHAIDGAEIIDLSPQLSKIDIQGPLATVILPKVIADPHLMRLQRFSFFDTAFNGRWIRISRSGYTGEGDTNSTSRMKPLPRSGARFLTREGTRELPRPAWARAIRFALRRATRSTGMSSPMTSRRSRRASAGSSTPARTTSAEALSNRRKRGGSPRMMVCFELTGKGIPAKAAAS
jgi:aminomethyltransferase